MHAYVLVCLRALWRIYVRFVTDIDIKILGGAGFSCILVCWCRVCMYVSWRFLELAHPELTLLLLSGIQGIHCNIGISLPLESSCLARA